MVRLKDRGVLLYLVRTVSWRAYLVFVLAPSFWCYAVHLSTHVANLTPVHSLGYKSPYEMLALATGKTIGIAGVPLYKFSAAVIMHLEPQNRDTGPLAKNAVEGVFLGIFPVNLSYYVWRPDTKLVSELFHCKVQKFHTKLFVADPKQDSILQLPLNPGNTSIFSDTTTTTHSVLSPSNLVTDTTTTSTSYTVFVFWCKRGLVCRCLKPFTPNRNYGAEFPERSENRFR